ncbi:MAG TPA: hypothetical protein DIS93_00130 [Bdellovibrionales bacterium]|nr:hypothetical protein [Bdellovibrionales bacterium]
MKLRCEIETEGRGILTGGIMKVCKVRQKWLILVFTILLTSPAYAAGNLVQSIRGKVLRINESTFEIRVGKEVMTLAKDPLLPSAEQEAVQPGDEVEISYVREIREIQRVGGQKPGRVPEEKPLEEKPKDGLKQEPLEDDRIYYNT